jgi:hypothetical protein
MSTSCRWENLVFQEHHRFSLIIGDFVQARQHRSENAARSAPLRHCQPVAAFYHAGSVNGARLIMPDYSQI